MKKETKNEIFKEIIVSMGISIGKNIVSDVFQIIKSNNLAEIDVTDEGSYMIYNNMNKIIYKLDKYNFNKNRMPSYNNNTYLLQNGTNYMLKINKFNYIKVETYESKNPSRFHLKLTFIGKNKFKNRDKLFNESIRRTDKNHVHVEYLIYDSFSYDIIPHKFENIIIHQDIKDRIVKGLNNYKRSESWYKEHEMIYKMGILLYGKPGTGKSTIVKAISMMFDNAPILIINPSDVMVSIRRISDTRRSYNGTIIVLIEDFDMFFKKREEADTTNKTDKKSTEMYNQNIMFQMLDGVYSTDNTIYIATTNYKDRIDPALIRHGRFDIQEELDYFDYDSALKCVKLFGYDEKVLNEINSEYPVQPALLQSKIMEYRSKHI